MLLAIGVLFMFIGFLFCLTIIGSVIGIPMMTFGAFLIIVGVFMRRKTVITNIVHVTNTPVMPMPDSSSRAPQPANYAEPNRMAYKAPRAIEAAHGSLRGCPSCNENNAPDSRFCTNCGNPLVAPAT